jgi:hypothetical protein
MASYLLPHVDLVLFCLLLCDLLCMLDPRLLALVEAGKIVGPRISIECDLFDLVANLALLAGRREEALLLSGAREHGWLCRPGVQDWKSSM